MGPRGLRESDVVLRVCLQVRRLLAPVADVAMTRETDVFVPLGRRAVIANDWQADAVLSVHCNAGPVGSGDGFEVFTSPGPTMSDLFATDLFRAFAAAFPSKRKRMDLSDGDPDKEARFTVLMRTHGRAALFELEFIHTHLGEDWLRQPLHLTLCAEALAEGIRNHFKLSSKS